MRFINKAVSRGLILGSTVFALAACGGGGGGGVAGMAGGPKPANTYSVKITADRTALPLNISGARSYPGSPYTTTLYVEGMINGQRAPIPSSGEATFSCSITSGFESGAFYYHDGDPSHYRKVTVTDPTDPSKTAEVDIESPYRSVTLGANAGVGTVHFHSSKIAGTATIRCSTMDPNSKKVVADQISVVVGSDSNSKQPSQIKLKFQEGQTLLTTAGWAYAVKPMFIQGVNIDTQRTVQVEVLDEAGQRVPNPAPGKANIKARLLQGTEGVQGAVLRSGASQGQEINARTVNGLAQFTIVSGSNPGSIMVEFYTDRADNDVTNGIGFPVANREVVQVFAPSAGKFEFVGASDSANALPAVEVNKPYAYALEVKGGYVLADGSAPFTHFEVMSGSLPAGIVLRKDGELYGTPTVAGSYAFTVQASQSDGAHTATQQFTLLVYEPLKIVTTALPNAKANTAYSAQIQASGGIPPYIFSKTGGNCAWAEVNASGAVSGTPTAAGSCSLEVTVLDDGGSSITKVANTVKKAFNITIEP